MSDHYDGLRQDLAEGEELRARMLACVDVKRVLMLRVLASGRYAFALERPTMTMPRYVVGTTTALNDDPHVGGCFVLEAAALASFERDYGVRDPAPTGSACVALAALDLPGWVVVGVILLVMCWLAIEAAIALEQWCREREAEHDEDCAWHVKRHAPQWPRLIPVPPFSFFLNRCLSMALHDDIAAARADFRFEAVRMALAARRLSRLTAAGASADALSAAWGELRADMVAKATPALQQALRLEDAAARA